MHVVQSVKSSLHQISLLLLLQLLPPNMTSVPEEGTNMAFFLDLGRVVSKLCHIPSTSHSDYVDVLSDNNTTATP